MKIALFILQSISVAIATFFLYVAGKMFAVEYALSQDNIFVDLIIVLGVIGIIFVLLSLLLHCIRQKKFGFIYKNPLIPSICFLVLMLLPIIWITWIIGGLFFDQLLGCIPYVDGRDALDTLPYHLIAAGIILFIQLVYFLTFYFTEKSLSRRHVKCG